MSNENDQPAIDLDPRQLKRIEDAKNAMRKANAVYLQLYAAPIFSNSIFDTLPSLPKEALNNLIYIADYVFGDTSTTMSPEDIKLAMEKV